MRTKINRAFWLTCLLAISLTLRAQKEQKPVDKKFQTQTEVILPIKDFGKVYNVPFAEDRPDPNMQYKIVFEAGEKIDSVSQIYPPLEHVARMYNLHVYGGVPQKNMDVVLVIGGMAIPVVLNNEAYKKRFGVDNPNLKILEELKAAGIKINGCAQAMMKSLIEPVDVIPIVTPIFSRFTTVSAYQLKGYAYFKY